VVFCRSLDIIIGRSSYVEKRLEGIDSPVSSFLVFLNTSVSIYALTIHIHLDQRLQLIVQEKKSFFHLCTYNPYPS
jgi:hypothetical protein